jgi:hypothetical protein
MDPNQYALHFFLPFFFSLVSIFIIILAINPISLFSFFVLCKFQLLYARDHTPFSQIYKLRNYFYCLAWSYHKLIYFDLGMAFVRLHNTLRVFSACHFPFVPSPLNLCPGLYFLMFLLWYLIIFQIEIFPVPMFTFASPWLQWSNATPTILPKPGYPPITRFETNDGIESCI